jgi:hypothetical protein
MQHGAPDARAARGDAAGRVWCRYCAEYPARSRQPGSGMCVAAASARSSDSRPCRPRLTLTGRVRKLFGRPIG